MKLWNSTFDETVTRNPYLVRPKGKREARDAYEKKFVASGVVKAASMSRDFKGRIKAYLECRLGRKL
jgi:hypothetical protein